MLERLQGMAIRFRKLGPYLLVLAICALCVGVYALLTSNDHADDAALIPAFMLFTWATMARSFIVIFTHVPEKTLADAGFWLHMKVAVKRGIYYGFFLLFAVATAFLLLSTWQLSSVWRMMY